MTWSQRRALLSHRDLRNTIGTAINAAIAECRNNGLTPWLNEKIIEILEELTRIQHEATVLLASCIEQMSPKSLFRESPLVHLDLADAIVLSEIIHQYWLQKHGVLQKLTETLGILSVVGRCAKTLQQDLSSIDKTGSCFARDLEELGNACNILADAFSRLPCAVEV